MTPSKWLALAAAGSAGVEVARSAEAVQSADYFACWFHLGIAAIAYVVGFACLAGGDR